MKTYLIRATKYFLSLIILLAVIFALMFLSGTSTEDNFIDILASQRGQLMILALLGLSLAYPYFGYVNRKIKCNIQKDELIKFFEICGYSLKGESQAGYLIFKSNSLLKRAKTMGEDLISVELSQDEVTLQGLRKEIVRLEYRLITFIKNNEI